MYRVLLSVGGRLRRDERGAVLPLFTVALLSLLLITGVGIDFGNALVVKQKLISAADAAALAVGSEPGLTNEQATAKGQAFIRAHYPETDFGDLIDFNVVPTASQVDVTVTARVPTTFMRIAGFDTLDVTVHSQVLRQQRDLEVVMALDNTGSMALGTKANGRACDERVDDPESCNSKMDDLKVAANKLVTVLFGDSPTSEHVKIGLVPFSAAVNIGTDKIGKGWLDEVGNSFLQTEDIDLPSNMTLLDLFGKMHNTSWGGCVRARISHSGEDLDLTDDPPTSTDTRWVPYFAPDEPDSGSYPNTYILYGCVDSKNNHCSTSDRIRDQRDYSHYIGKSSNHAGLGPNFNCVPQPIQPLTNVKSTITTAIQGMQAEGSTVIPAGLGWGWRVISPTEPYTEGAPYTDQRVAKAIILLTDGRNQVEYESSQNHNKSFYSAYGYAAEGHLGKTDGSQSRRTLDDKTTALCNAIKANKDDITDDQDIYIYTITFQVDDASARTLMHNCATPPADCPGEKCSFNSPSGSDLQDAFESIALGLNKLRVAQ